MANGQCNINHSVFNDTFLRSLHFNLWVVKCISGQVEFSFNFPIFLDENFLYVTITNKDIYMHREKGNVICV